MYIPRLFIPRKKSLYLRIIIFIPFTWLAVTLIFLFNERIVNIQNTHQSQLPVRVNDKVKLSNNDEKSSEIKKPEGHAIRDENLLERAAVIPHPKHVNPEKSYGEMGKPVVLTNVSSDIQSKIDKGWKDNAFNQYISDIISLDRKLPDVRDPRCRALEYNVAVLPPTSVIICFHNEAWSVLLRTVKSVLNTSPAHLITEIILVDDCSDLANLGHLGKPLEDYIQTLGKVKIIRSPKRVGLIRARILGGAAATGPVLTYLDSHCECTEGWLEPLLDRIARNPTTVVCPIVDSIDDKTFEYHYNPDAEGIMIGGFEWNLQFNWYPIPPREIKRRPNATDPVFSPTMAGGLFSIDKSFFEKIGTYDNGFDIWGAENLELSFKTWMCGGTLEFLPCSHVGHVFRDHSPYKWRTGVDVLKRNSIRLAEVWMDDYKKYYYKSFNNMLIEYGDVSSRKALRKKLGCKSFDWYVKNVYPELFLPDESIAWGEIRNLGGIILSKMCIDSRADDEDFQKPVGLFPCHSQGGNQYWFYSRQGQIRRNTGCLNYDGHKVELYRCHGNRGDQYWLYDHILQRIKHGKHEKCLQMSADGVKTLMNECSEKEAYQRWKFQHFNASRALI